MADDESRNCGDSVHCEKALDVQKSFFVCECGEQREERNVEGECSEEAGAIGSGEARCADMKESIEEDGRSEDNGEEAKYHGGMRKQPYDAGTQCRCGDARGVNDVVVALGEPFGRMLLRPPGVAGPFFEDVKDEGRTEQPDCLGQLHAASVQPAATVNTAGCTGATSYTSSTAARRSSATLQACAIHPRGVCGVSASAISEI